MGFSGFANSSNYLDRVGALVTAPPLTMVARVMPASLPLAASSTIVECGTTGTTSRRFTLSAGTTGQINAWTQQSGGSSATTAAAMTVGAWNSAAAIFASATSRIARLNGVNSSTETTSRVPVAGNMNRTRVGVICSNASEAFSGGALAEVAIYNVVLNEDELAAFDRGHSPLQIRPASRLLYLPLVRDLVDLHGTGFSVVGTLGAVSHPRGFLVP